MKKKLIGAIIMIVTGGLSLIDWALVGGRDCPLLIGSAIGLMGWLCFFFARTNSAEGRTYCHDCDRFVRDSEVKHHRFWST